MAPTAAERDEEERFDRELFDQMAELGLTGIPWPEEYGGIGSDYLAYVIAIEELSRVCASTGVTLSAHTSLAGWPIFKFGTEEQKQKFYDRWLKEENWCIRLNGTRMRMGCWWNEDDC